MSSIITPLAREEEEGRHFLCNPCDGAIPLRVGCLGRGWKVPGTEQYFGLFKHDTYGSPIGVSSNHPMLSLRCYNAEHQAISAWLDGQVT